MKKTSIFKLFLGLALVVCAGFNLANFSSNEKKIDEIEEVVAETPSDYPYIYRFVVPGNFGEDVGNKIWIKGWGSSGHDFEGWGELTQYSYDENSNRIYIFPTPYFYQNFVITRYADNENYCKSADISTTNPYSGQGKCWYWNGVNGSVPTLITNTTKTFYLYDYTNMFGGNAKCYAWQSNGSFNNGTYPGQTMNKVSYGSGQLYIISLDAIFDRAIFGIGDSANTGDQWINQHPGECFCWWKAGDGGFNADLDWIKAHDWIYQTMQIRDIQTTNNDDTGACRGSNGYYKKAKESYQSFTAQIKTKISEDDCFEIACDRFHAWSLANGEDAYIENNILTVNLRYDLMSNIQGENNSGLPIIILVSLLSISSLTVLLIIKRKKVR